MINVSLTVKVVTTKINLQARALSCRSEVILNT